MSGQLTAIVPSPIIDGRILTPVHIRYALRADWPSILAIEMDSEGPTPARWWIESTLNEPNTYPWVALDDNDFVVGHVVFTLADSFVQVRTIGVDPRFRRQGVGRQLIQFVARELDRERYHAWIAVRERAIGLQKFLANVGFTADEVYRHHFPDTGEDAYLMTLEPDFDELPVASAPRARREVAV